MNLTGKTIYQFFSKDISEIEKTFLDLMKIGNQEIKNNAKELYEILQNKIESEYLNLDQQVLHCLDIDLVNSFLADANNKEITGNLIDHLKILLVATGIVSGITSYNLLELKNILTEHNKNYDNLKLIHSLRQMVNGQYRHDCALYACYTLNWIKKIDDIYKPLDLLTFIFLLNIAWGSFSGLPEENKLMLLQNYFCVSVYIKVPIRKSIVDYFYDTIEPFFYVINYKEVFDGLSTNTEEVLIDLETNIKKSLLELVKDFSNKNADFETDKEKQSAFVNSLYENNDVYLASSLQEIISIYFGVKNVSLIDKNRGGEMKESDIYEDQSVNLIIYFFDVDLWSKIVEYYRGYEQLVSLNNFLKQLADNIDLNDILLIEKLLKFCVFLKENKLISANQELIIYNEEKKKFEWNFN